MSRCLAYKKNFERCKNPPEGRRAFCRQHRWWPLKASLSILGGIGFIIGLIAGILQIRDNCLNNHLASVTPSETVTMSVTELPEVTTLPERTPTAVPSTTPESTQTATEPPQTTNLGESILWDWPQDFWPLASKNPRLDYTSIVRFHPTASDILAVGSQRGDLILLRLNQFGVLYPVGKRVDHTDNGRLTDMLFSQLGDYLITTYAENRLDLRRVNFSGIDPGIATDPTRSTIMSSAATAIALSRPEGNRLAVASGDGLVNFRILANQGLIKALQFPALDTYIWDIVFSADGSTLYVAGSSNYLQPWRVSELDSDFYKLQGWTVPAGAIVALAASPASQNLLAISTDLGTISLWQDGKQIAHFSSPDGEIWTLEFSHDGKYIAASTLDCFLLLYDAKNLKLLSSRDLCQGLPSKYSRRIENLDFSNNDSYIAVGYARGAILVPVILNH